ncbi:MAG: hypothetical protein HYX25_06355 [Candidatus Solibacter usitatus]|nr:hypothetical protein [Candidatus Solibacter usitatus]
MTRKIPLAAAAAPLGPARLRSADLKRSLDALKIYGLLLMTDASLPSVAGLVAGGPVRGSWWAHPQSHAIYAVLMKMEHDSAILTMKLISSKVTFVHRSLWPAAIGVASAREPWQTKALTRDARALLAEINRRGEMRADGLPGLVTRELENALLVHAEEFHTETGAHGKRLQTWEHWARLAGFAGDPLPADEARAALEGVLERLNREFQAAGRLPWQTGVRPKKRAPRRG